MTDIMRIIFSTPGRRRWSAASVLGTAGVVLVVVTLSAGIPATASMTEREGAAAAVEGGTSPELRELESRVSRVTEAWSEAQRYYEAEVAPIERVLLRYRAEPELASRVAVALVREANNVGLEPRLLLAVLLVENPWLDPDIRSSVGAVGLMQVMPLHLGAWEGCGRDLEDVDSNICYGARIFAHYFNRSGGNLERALLRYNGCVRGTNTPNCHEYPYHVFARAGKASMLAWMETGTAAGSP